MGQSARLGLWLSRAAGECGVGAEYLAYLPEQGGFVEWFFDQVDTWFEYSLCAEQPLGVAGHVENGDVWVEFADVLGDLLALHSGHDHVGEEHGDAVLAGGGGLDGLAAVCCGDDLVAVAGQDAAGYFAHGWLVFDQEH